MLRPQIRKLEDDAFWPELATPFASGLDLICRDDVEIPPGETKLISTGVAIKLYPGLSGRIENRSSNYKRQLRVRTAIIDCDYDAELILQATNENLSRPLVIHRGERVAQIVIEYIFMPYEILNFASFTDSNCLNHPPRGAKGFGSSGMFSKTLNNINGVK